MRRPKQTEPCVFRPPQVLTSGVAEEGCRVCVAVPARDEEDRLPAALDALARQVDCSGVPLEAERYEILLLLNNCRDRSAERARAWHASHPWVSLLIFEREFPPAEAHAGTARALLMDTAWCRLQGPRAQPCAILSTDADTEVAPDWIAATLRALESGAEAVGGRIQLRAAEYDGLPDEVRRCYRDDARYGELIAQLEDLIDPQPGDPWPRHLDHFGASLACTPSAYARAGGLPAVPQLEDAAFVDRLWRAEIRLRHDPEVRVVTSARLQGRVAVGMSELLRRWSGVRETKEHTVPSADFLRHRFRTLRALRELCQYGVSTLPIPPLPRLWRARLHRALNAGLSMPEFLGDVDANGLIDAAFAGAREEPVETAIAGLLAYVAEEEGLLPLTIRSSTESR